MKFAATALLWAAACGIPGNTAPAKKPPARQVIPRSTPDIEALRDRLFPPHAPDSTDKAIGLWEQKLKARPRDTTALTSLAGAFLQKARETADVSYVTRAAAAADRALRITPGDYEAIQRRSQIYITLHQFEQAVRLAQQAHQANPRDPINYATLGDAFMEIGDYNAAEKNYQKMVDLRPGRAAYTRMSYLLEVYGDDRNALKMMRLAVQSGSQTGEDAAWCHTQLGHLYYNKGFLPAAEKEYQAALACFPGYCHAYAALGKVKAARRDYAGAIAMYNKALEAAPFLQYVAELADVYAVTGQTAKAKAQMDLVEVVRKLNSANGMQDVDLQMALIDAEQGRHLPQDLKLAQKHVQTRKNIRAYDALAWIACLNGQYSIAQAAMKQALRLGTADSLFYYHAARIQEGLGNKSESVRLLNKALYRCPYFHVRYADDARSRMDRLAKGLAAERATATAR